MSLKVSTANDGDAPVKLTEVQARKLCVGADNGRTPGSSWNNAGQPTDLIRFNFPFESCGVEIGNSSGGASLAGEGQLIGATSGWTPQFTSNTANDGKGNPPDGSTIDLNTWIGYFNSILDSNKYCAAFGVRSAPTWRYMRVCTIDPCARFGLWTLKWLDGEPGLNVFNIGWPEDLVEEEVIKRAYLDREDKDGSIVREWYEQKLDSETGEFEWAPSEQPTWKPSLNADPVAIPNDCWISCAEKFPDWRVDGAESPCTYKTFDICDFLDDGSQIELKLFLTDCEGSRVRELYTADQVLTSTDPLDPDVDQYEVQGELKNCDGSSFEEPPVEPPVIKPDAIVHVCYEGPGEPGEPVKAAYDVSDFDEGATEPGQQACIELNIELQEGCSVTSVYVPANPDVTVTGTGPYKLCFIADGSRPEWPIEVAIECNGATGVIKGGDLTWGSGAGESLLVETSKDSVRLHLKELCYAGKPSTFQNEQGEAVSVEGLTKCAGDSDQAMLDLLQQIVDNTTCKPVELPE